ncbi:MAG: hypothetical protein ACRDX8_00880 [Acidimicrobiales bacterium]
MSEQALALSFTHGIGGLGLGVLEPESARDHLRRHQDLSGANRVPALVCPDRQHCGHDSI